MSNIIYISNMKQIPHMQTVPPDSNRKDEIESYYLRNIAIPLSMSMSMYV